MCRKAALQCELENLKQQLFQGCAHVSPMQEELPQAMSTGSWQRLDVDANMLPLQTTLPSTVNTYSTFSRTDSSEEGGPSSAAAVWLEDCISPGQSATLPRMLDGREYDAQRIDDCFGL